jgi:hypothetical protein
VNRTTLAITTAVLAVALTACTPTTAPHRLTGPSPNTTGARQQLASLTVFAPHPTGYVRTKFGDGWANQGHGCNTREAVLKTQGSNVRTDRQCRALSGSWVSPYDAQSYTSAAKLQIDHVVPLGEAWAAGAWSWSDAQRLAFANNLADPELIAVTARLNEQKGDRRPDQWKPPLTSFWPTYAADWIAVKAKFHLTVTAPEKTALQKMLG